MNTQLVVITVPAEEWNETKDMIKSLCSEVGKLTTTKDKELLTPNEVCELLKIGRTTFQRYISSGILEPVRVNRNKYSKIYVKRSDIEALINEGNE